MKNDIETAFRKAASNARSFNEKVATRRQDEIKEKRAFAEKFGYVLRTDGNLNAAKALERKARK